MADLFYIRSKPQQSINKLHCRQAVRVGHCLNGSPPAYTDMWPITAGQSFVDT